MNDQRVARFNERISAALAAGEGEPFRALIERYESEHNVPAVEIAAALASIAQGKKPLLLDAESGNDARKPRNASAQKSDPRRAAREARASAVARSSEAATRSNSATASRTVRRWKPTASKSAACTA